MTRALNILLFTLLSYCATASAQEPIDFVEIAKKSLPAVVNVSASQKVDATKKLQVLPENPFELFEFFQNEMNPDKPKKEYSLGSGFIIDPKGYIVTNHHVIADSDYVEVGLDGDRGKRYKAKIIGKDKKTDLALLKINPTEDLPFLELGDSDSRKVGEWVITIGNPYGLGGSVTKGIISAKARQLNTSQFDDFIQTDAPINRGNSGGPMISMDGKVIGVNTVILSPSGGSIGIGFAVPSSLVKHIVDQLREFGQVKRSWLGAKIQNVDDKIATTLGMGNPQGALVAQVNPESPAEKAGILAGDVITKFNGIDIASSHRLPLIVSEIPAGQTVEVVIFRNKKYKTIKVTLESAPETVETTGDDSEPKAPTYQNVSEFGLTVRELDSSIKKKYGVDSDIQGVLVTKVDDHVESMGPSVRPGDVIMKVNQEPVYNLKEFKEAAKKVKNSNDKAVMLFVSSKGQNHFVVLDLQGESNKKDE